MIQESRLLRCACGWEARGSIDELVVAAGEHGRRVHNMEPTRDQVLEMVVDERASTAEPAAAPLEAAGEAGRE
jgi:predicted small metal-binding protein